MLKQKHNFSYANIKNSHVPSKLHMRFRRYFRQTTSVTEMLWQGDITTFRFPKASRSLTIQHHDSTCLYNATWGWTVTRNQREGESTSRNLEEGHVSQTSCHRVFSVARLFLFLSLSLFHFLSRANLRCLRRHACRRSRWVGLACQNLPDATVLPAPRCKSRTEESERGMGEPRKEEEHRTRTQQDGMVKRAEDGRCLVVCRIWVSDLGPRPAVGRRVCQGNLFSRPSPSLPLAPLSPSLPDALFSVCLSLRSSRWAGRPAAARYTLRSSLSRELKTGRELCPSAIFTALFARVMETFDVRKNFSPDV